MINNNILKNIKIKYKKFREINNVIGFIVNVHNATNYDIDLFLPNNIHEKYKNVIMNKYSYNEVDDNMNIEKTIKNSYTYRCRLKGVGINGKSEQSQHDCLTNPSDLSNNGVNPHCLDLPVKGKSEQSKHDCLKNYYLTIDIKQLIDRTDGWILCNISDIDVYKRLLVEIIVPTMSGDVNIKNLILDNSKNESNPIYYHYLFKK
jgi:hypothetical protein